MNKIISRLFGHSRTRALPVHSQPASIDNPQTIMDGSENATRRQLVQVLLRDLLRRSGIPPQWVECQVQVVSSRTKGAGMVVRLVVKHWDARLMNYTFAFQNELMSDISRFDPEAPNWLHGMSWQLEVGGSCPFTSLPNRQFWSETAKPTATAIVQPPQAVQTIQVVQAEPVVQEAVEKPRFEAPHFDSTQAADDLEKLFAIRDRELDRQAAQGVMPVGYEKTQPSPL